MIFLTRFWLFVQESKHRKTLSWLGAGVFVCVAGVWATFVYFDQRDRIDPVTVMEFRTEIAELERELDQIMAILELRRSHHTQLSNAISRLIDEREKARAGGDEQSYHRIQAQINYFEEERVEFTITTEDLRELDRVKSRLEILREGLNTSAERGASPFYDVRKHVPLSHD